MTNNAAEKLIDKKIADESEQTATPAQIENKKQFDHVFAGVQFDESDTKLYRHIFNALVGVMWQFSNPDLVPNCADKTLSFRKVREAIFHLERAISQKEKYRRNE